EPAGAPGLRRRDVEIAGHVPRAERCRIFTCAVAHDRIHCAPAKRAAAHRRPGTHERRNEMATQTTHTTRTMTVSLLVRSYDEALAYYTGKLGFVVVEDVPMGDLGEEEDRWVTITRPGTEGCVLTLHEARSADDLALVGGQGGSFPLLGIATEDCRSEYERM